MNELAAPTRREFLKALGAGTCAVCAAGVVGPRALAGGDGPKPRIALHDAEWFEKLEDKAVRCKLCPRECVVAEVERGWCGVRENRGGDYKTLVYGNLCSINADPIEKKPLFHYLPGTTALSVATAGCNMECKFCQNWEISQFRPEQVPSRIVSPRDLAGTARRNRIETMAFTYGEPTVFYEYMHDAAAAGREMNVGSVAITNGFMQEAPMRALCKQLTGIKIDLKAFTEEFYRDVCAAELAPVQRTLEVLAEIGIHTEIVVLLIPTLNDSVDEVARMAKWIAKAMGLDIPVHFSRFHPTYRLKNLPPTPLATMEAARKAALDAGLKFVYLGNVPFHAGEHTWCPSCGKKVIERMGFRSDPSGLAAGKCAGCGTAIPGVWSRKQALAFKPKAEAAE